MSDDTELCYLEQSALKSLHFPLGTQHFRCSGIIDRNVMFPVIKGSLNLFDVSLQKRL